jgi:hypothetical protein
MASDIDYYTPLKTIIAYFCDANGKSDGDQDQAWIIGLRACVDLGYEFAASPQTVRLPINANKTASFPAGVLSWTKVGLLNEHGETVTLKINNGLTKWRDLNPNRIELLTPDINNSISAMTGAPLYLNYYYNGSYVNLFGVSTGLIQYSDCRVDEENKVIVLPTDFRYDHVMFEYISAPQKQDDYMVLTSMQEAVIAFIEWKLKIAPREMYIAAKVEARRRMPNKKVTLQQVNDIVRCSNGMKLRS